MGDMADDLVEGRTCSYCGVMFVESHDYPVLCRECFKQQKKDIAHGEVQRHDALPKSMHKELGE